MQRDRVLLLKGVAKGTYRTKHADAAGHYYTTTYIDTTFFTGTPNFQAAEVEVYQVVLQSVKSDRPDCISVRVPLESFGRVFKCVPDVRAPLLRALNVDQNFFDAQIEVLRGLFAGDKQETPQWPSAKANKMLENPPLLLAERFPAVIDGIMDAIKRDLKPKADAKIREAVKDSVQRFSDEVVRADGWRKRLVAHGVCMEVVTSERLSELCEELVLIFLRYHADMLEEVRACVRQVVERVSLIESCAEQRREIVSRQRALEQAEDGVFELIGVRTPEEKEEWMLSAAAQTIDSKILSPQQHDQVRLWLQDTRGPGQVKLELLYRASRDGFRARDFHSRCDDKGATITVIKCSGGFVFGGYADVPWHSQNNYTRSSQAFLFSLHSPSGVGPVKLPLFQNHQNAMYCVASYGPTFGGGHDIHVADGANGNTNSYTNLHAYQLPAGQSAQTFFTGAHNFQAAEVEVYQVQLQ